ncbi:enoyl-CoA hydratase-related protein [Paraburkholderia agricolaris]|uniref:enoyl-CoA hydratase/isomerase family protein n=1 Tax=Paraburkholderia agricolaris TaxID=2152888 RepID=UPI0038BAC759
MGPNAVRCRVEAGVATITLDKPETKNSLSIPEMVEVGVAVRRAASAGARCILITGVGDAFCAGRDLKGVNLDEDDTYELLAREINPALKVVRECEVPTIASVAGPALGFGFGLALACDLTIAADNAIFGSPFRKIGLLPDSGAHYYLRERLGRHRAAELIMTGRMLSGRQAAELGLINRSCGAEELYAVTAKLARDIAHGPTRAFGLSKRILDSGDSYADMAELEAVSQHEAINGSDGREGVRAFQEKRAPRFIGN